MESNYKLEIVEGFDKSFINFWISKKDNNTLCGYSNSEYSFRVHLNNTAWLNKDRFIKFNKLKAKKLVQELNNE